MSFKPPLNQEFSNPPVQPRKQRSHGGLERLYQSEIKTPNLPNLAQIAPKPNLPKRIEMGMFGTSVDDIS